MPEQPVELSHLVKHYGDFTAVHEVSFTVEEGEIFGILGPNGSGKTTTVESLQGLRKIDGGTVRLLGLDPLTQAAEIRRRIGSQLQESALPDRRAQALSGIVDAGLGCGRVPNRRHFPVIDGERRDPGLRCAPGLRRAARCRMDGSTWTPETPGRSLRV
jgi:hypothetical protein